MEKNKKEKKDKNPKKLKTEKELKDKQVGHKISQIVTAF
jgi:hypothetical protein